MYFLTLAITSPFQYSLLIKIADAPLVERWILCFLSFILHWCSQQKWYYDSSNYVIKGHVSCAWLCGDIYSCHTIAVRKPKLYGHMKATWRRVSHLQPSSRTSESSWKWTPPAPVKLSRTKKSYRFMSKINGGGCFKPLSFRVVWREGTIHLSNEVQWNPSPLTPGWTPLHSMTASRSSLPHAFLTPLLPWECLLPTAVLLLLDGFTQLVCEAPLIALVGCDIFLLSNLGELCFYHLYVSPQLRFSTFHSWQGQVLTAQKRASCVISPVIWWPSILQQSWLHIVLAPLVACTHLQGRVPHVFLSSECFHLPCKTQGLAYNILCVYIYIYIYITLWMFCWDLKK